MEQSVVPKIRRWKLRLDGNFEFQIIHIPGKNNIIADSLSRLHAISTEEEEFEIERQQSIIQDHHNAIVGHFGVNATIKKLRDLNIKWLNMRHDIQKYIDQCPTCQKTRIGQGSVVASRTSRAVTQPFHTLEIDFIGPLPKDEFGNEYILVIIDVFTKYVELFATRSPEARAVATSLLHIFGRYGLPGVLVMLVSP
jgi:Integrase zinc binding domain